MTASPAESGRFHMETPEAGTWFGILKGTAIMICEMTDGTWTVWDAGIQRSSNDEELSLDEAALWAIRYAAMKGGSRA